MASARYGASMRAALVSRRDDQSPSGIGTYVRALAGELADRVDLERVQVPKTEVRIGDRALGGALSLIWNTYRARVPDDVDVVHATDIAVLHAATDVLTVHDVIPFRDGGSTYARALELAYGGRLDDVRRFIAVSKASAREAADLLDLPEDRFRVVHQAIDHATFFPARERPPGLGEAERSAVFVGEWTPRKNVHRIVRALAELAGWQLVRVGPPGDEAYAERCRELAREHDVPLRDAGFVDLDDLRRYYTFADLHVFPSKAEGFGFPPLEAAACGTASVVSDLSVFREVYGDHVVYADSTEPAAIADAIRRAETEAPDAETLRDFAAEFTWERTAEETVDVYREVVEAER